MRSVRLGDSQGDKVKDLKKYLKREEEINTTEAEILSRAVEIALRHYDELVEDLKSSSEKDKGVIQYILENPERGQETNAAEDHDVAGV